MTAISTAKPDARQTGLAGAGVSFAPWSRDADPLRRARAHSEIVAWLDRVSTALSARGPINLGALVIDDSEWRDVVALTSTIGHVRGPEAIAALLLNARDQRGLDGVVLDEAFAPSRARRAGEDVIEGAFHFTTSFGPGRGVVRLIDDRGVWKARTVLSTLDQLVGFEERTGRLRPSGKRYSSTFGGDNWAQLRQKSLRYDNREPEVLIVGAGQAALSLGARLRAMGIDALLVDPHATVGDNWHKRYHSLTLHNEIWVNHMPFMPFPETWPMYAPKDMLGEWFEAYARAMQVNVWTETPFVGAEWDEDLERWIARVNTPEGERVLHPRHIVMAVGLSGRPRYGAIPGLEEFAGDVEHSGAFSRAADFRGLNCVVFGTGTSGHDAAQELLGAGAAKVTIVQRNPTTVVSLDPSSRYAYSLYEEDLTTEQADLVVQASGTYPTMRRTLKELTEELKRLDSDLLQKLESAGFRVDFGEDGTGHQMKQLQKGGGFYINVGASDLIIDGTIGLVQNDDIVRVVPEGLSMVDGGVIPADLIVLATGYQTLQTSVEEFFGPEVAANVGPIWGFGEDGEMRNMWRATPQKNLWFTGGSFSQCRIYSKALAQQIALAGVEQDVDEYSIA